MEACTHNVLVRNRWRAAGKNDLFRLAFSDHLHDFPRCGAVSVTLARVPSQDVCVCNIPSYKTIVYNQDITSFKLALNGRQLSADALFAKSLLRY
jgi:hypothetical protein